MNLLILLMAFALLPWTLRFRTVWQPATLSIAVLGLGTVFGPSFFSINGPIQISLDRLAYAVLMIGIACQLARGQHVFGTFSRLDPILLLFAIWALGSCLCFGLTNAEQPPIARWLFFVAMPAGMYFAGRSLAGQGSDSQDSQRKLSRWVDALVTMLVALSLYLAITGICEMKDWRAFVFPRFINDPDVWEFYGRGRGPLLNPAGNGVLMTLGLAACVIRFFESGRVGKIGYLFAATIVLAGCYSTLTRSVWLGAGMTLALLSLLYVPVRFRIVGLMLAVCFGGALSLGLKEQLLSIKRDKDLSAAEAAKSIELRPLLAIVAYEMFKDRPLAGHGYGQYYQASEPYHAIRHHETPLEHVRPYMQHNVFLSILVDLGLVGLSLYSVILLMAVAVGWRLASSHPDRSVQRRMGILLIGILVSYLCNGLFHAMDIIEMMHMYLFFLIGLTVSVSQVETAADPRGRHDRRQQSQERVLLPSGGNVGSYSNPSFG